MKSSARFQTTIEIIDHILLNPAVPSDRLLVDYLRQRRFIGSHDRRAITETVYEILRQWPVLTLYQSPLKGRQAVLWFLRVCQQYSVEQIREIFAGSNYSPASLSQEEEKNLATPLSPDDWPEWIKAATPEWLWPYCQDSFGENTMAEMQAFDRVAGFDVRINPLKTDRRTVFERLEAEGITVTETPYSPWGLRLPNRQALNQHKLWEDGHIEVQDEGSQLIAFLTDAQPGMRILDLCAGAGGKTLGLAAAMKNKGSLLATDIHEWRLKRARERLKRAGISNVECRALNDSWLKRQIGKFDRVLVDAPCSGTGTWRRNPDLKIRFQPNDLEELIQKQVTILQTAAATVKPGGRLIYATCSILKAENDEQVEQFLKNHPDFSLVNIAEVWQQVLGSPCPSARPTLQLTPLQHQTDGFFVSVFEKRG
jgi:16S rRNA (cytosine967-C5)-methyltransferase